MRKNTVNWKHGLGDRFRRVAALWCVCCFLFSCLPLPSRSDVEIQEEVSPSKQMSELLQMPETELEEEIPGTPDPAGEIEESVEAEEATVLQAVNAPVQVSITYYADAGLPDTTELVVREEAETEAAPAEEIAPLRKSAAKSLKTMSASPALKRTAASPENHNLNQDDITETADVSLTEWQVGEEAPTIPLYHRTLDISLVAEGEEIEPNPEASILVTVVLPDLQEGLEVEVCHETAAGSVLLESTTEGQQVTFVTDSFSLFDFSAAARQITSWTTDLLENAFYGIGNSAETRHNTIQAESPIEGLSVLEAFSVTRSSDLWMSLRRIADIALGKMESISLYTVANGQLSALVKENISLSDVLRMSLGNFSEFALVRDTGLRRRVEQIGSVLLNGLVPKNASATATDVTEEYTDFIPSRSVEQGEADETSIEQGETVGAENGEAAHTIAAYDISITNDGEEYQPEDKPIEVTIKDEAIQAAIAAGKTLSLWHVLDDGSKERIPDFTISGDTVTFSASGFSVYVLTETIYTYYNTASGETYKITVEYDSTAKLPQNAALAVSEILPGSTDYDNYVAQSIDKLGVKEEALSLSRVFDIKIVDESGAVKEPAAPVKVSIQLVGESLTDYASVDVVHFGESKIDEMDANLSGDTVEFTTDSFSVYVVDGTVHVRTYHYYTLNEYLEYVEYPLQSDTGETVYGQTVRSGERPVAPQNPVNPQDEEATFSGWYVGSASTDNPGLGNIPYDFNQVLDLTEDDVVYLYAKFSRYAYVIFHDQYDTESETFPVAFTRRVDLENGTEADWYVDIHQYSVSYEDPENVDDNKMAFIGWSDAPITIPGASLDDYGEPAAEISNDHGRIYVTDTIHLYPIFKSVKWISYYSGPSGSGATYFTDRYYTDGIGPRSLPGAEMSRNGNYQFVGWYASAENNSVTMDSNGEVNAGTGVQIADETGTLIAGASATGVTVQSVAASGEDPAYNYLALTENVTLYALWEQETTASYSIIIRRQKATDGSKPEADRSYEYAERFTLTGTIGDTISLDDALYKNYKGLNTLTTYNDLHQDATIENDTDNPYYGYVYDANTSELANPGTINITANGGATLILCYDWNDWNNPPTEITEQSFALTFVDSQNTNRIIPYIDEHENSHDTQTLLYGFDLHDRIPADPESIVSADGYSFAGWYTDETCTTRVLFTEDDFNSYSGSKVLYTTMPGANLTLYAGWMKNKFLIKIDPNYGELYKHVYTDSSQTTYAMDGENPKFEGNGSTWFRSEYGDYIQEYVTAKRDYVESDSGSWYYVKQDRDHYGYPDPDDPNYDPNATESKERKTYYTKDLNEATEFTTFEYDPGVYRYAGWYEIYSDGTESDTRYDFSRIVDHNITLRLRWQKTGVFYITYSPGKGTLTNGEESEQLYVELDGESYSDDADVVITRTATPPKGYEFIGWRIRQDESGTIYRPGSTFHLLSQYVATVQGKRTVFLDAVYERVPTATIVYHANGGSMSISGTVDYGSYPSDSGFDNNTLIKSYSSSEGEEATATVSRINNNAEFVLSDGSWLTMTDASFAGWCENSVFDPEDEDHPLLNAAGKYRIEANDGDTAEDQIVPLYAIWQVDVSYHLNAKDTDANFGGNWSSMTDQADQPIYSLENTVTYKQGGVLIGSNLGWPPYDPVYTDGSRSFKGWAIRTGSGEQYTDTLYDFSQPVPGALDLYAIWGEPISCSIKVVDSSNQQISVASWVDGDGDNTADGDAVITLTSKKQSLSTLAVAITEAAPTDYTFAFATVENRSISMQNIQEEPIHQIYYSPKDGAIHLVYDREQNFDVVLDEDNQLLYFVYYKIQTPSIGYLLMEIDGDVTDITSTMNNDAPTSMSQLKDASSDTGSFVIASSYQPMDWLPASVTNKLRHIVLKENITHYNFAIGAVGATNSVDLHHKTQAYTASDTRPEMYIQNTWRGIRFSLDGVNWFDGGVNPQLYVVYYTETPTVVTLYNKTVGLAADMKKLFTYDYWIEEIDFTESGEQAQLVFSTRNPKVKEDPEEITATYPQQLDNGDTCSPFTFTSSSHTYRVTFVLTPVEGFTVTLPTIPTIAGYTAPDTTLPSWVNDNQRSAIYQYNDSDIPYTFSYTVREGDGYCGNTVVIPFTNTRSAVYVDLHVARVSVENGNLYHQPEWRAAGEAGHDTVQDPNNVYTVTVQKDGEVNLPVVKAPSDIATGATDLYAFGNILYGYDYHTSVNHANEGENNEHDIITTDNSVPLGCTYLAYEKTDLKDETCSIYDLYLKDGSGSSSHRYPLSEMAEQIATKVNGQTAASGVRLYRVFYLYYPKLILHYVVENADGTLTPVAGVDGNSITYDGQSLTMNGLTVSQTQHVEMPISGLTISQEIGKDQNGNDYFNIPPLLDNGTTKLDLIYYKLGALSWPADKIDNESAVTTISELNQLDPNKPKPAAVTDTLLLYTRISDHKMQWRFGDQPWWTLNGWPTVYAIYRERGYNLTVIKTVPEDTGYDEPFTVTIVSKAINRDKYSVDGTGYTTIDAVPAQLDNENNLIEGTGVITFDVQDGDSVKIIGLGPEDYTITETGNDHFILSAQKKIGENSSAVTAEVADNSTIKLTLSDNTILDLTNTPQYICQYSGIKFYTLTSAIEYIKDHSNNFIGEIQMLVPEYIMPQSDAPEIPSYLTVRLTTANPSSSDADNLITAGTTAVIKRKGNLTKPMFNNLGTLNLNNITLDGNGPQEYAVPLISNEGILNLNSGSTIQNANSTENGAAVNSLKGTVKAGGVLTGCSAINGGAIYATGGTVNITTGGSLTNNHAKNGGAIYYAGEGTVTITGGTVGGEGSSNYAENGGAIYMESGKAAISKNGNISYNNATVDGGGIYALNAYVTISDNTSVISHNTAAGDGGAVHMETLTLTLNTGSVSYNSANNGGAFWSGTGKVEIKGGSVSRNAASMNGGGVFADASDFTMTGGTLENNTAVGDGGGVYANTGSVAVSGSSTRIQNNTAGYSDPTDETINGNGGGINAQSGAVSITNNAILTGNKATGGNGGALWVGIGTATLGSAIMGNAVTSSGSNYPGLNEAVNGSAVFINEGTATFDGTNVQGNIASNGGAVGVGIADARLYFANNIKITNNTMPISGSDPVASNVYLNFDTDAIINFQSLKDNAAVGIYVSDTPVTVDTTVLDQRGVPGARFGVYVNNNVVTNIGKITNDRTPNLSAKEEATNKKLYWIRNFTVNVYYVPDYTNGLPFGNSGAPDYTNDFYFNSNNTVTDTLNGGKFIRTADGTPPSYENAISEVAADIRLKGNVASGDANDTAVFGNAFVKVESISDLRYSDYLTRIDWDTGTNLWKFTKKDGTSVQGGANPNEKKTVAFIFTEPYYLKIENNAKVNNQGQTLVINNVVITVNGLQETIINNYGYLYAKNDEIQGELNPVQDSDLIIPYGQSVQILLLGGKNMAYSLEGSYYSTYDPDTPENNSFTAEDIGYRQRVTPITDSTETTIGSVESSHFIINGNTPSDSGHTHELIFGGDRGICRLVVGSRIMDSSTGSGYAVDGFVEEHEGEGATAEKYEYTFNSPNKANDFISKYPSYFLDNGTIKATIEMLMDYMMPESERVEFSKSTSTLTRDVTFQTAVDGHFRYDPDHTTAGGPNDPVNPGTNPRATVSRASGNNESFIYAPDGRLSGGDYADKLTLKNLIFDGKSYGGNNIEHGIIDTNGWNVEIDHCDFNNCQAKYGGGMFIKSVAPGTATPTPYGYLTIKYSNFNNCQSLFDTDKYGGGAVWTSMKNLTVENSNFTNCYASQQGGALFHYVCTTGDYESYTKIEECKFEGCSAGQAAGSLESGAKEVRVTNTIFQNSTSNAKNGGALNIWSGNSDSTSGLPSTDCRVYLTGCTFENCYALNGTGDRGNGGAMRSTARYNTITECTFINNIGNNGGAINIYNSNAVDTILSGCTFNGCSARNQGGAIWCRSKTLKIDSTDHATDSATTNDTSIRNCTAPGLGGGVYHDNSTDGSDLTMTDVTIDTCSSTKDGGGGVYSTALTVSLTDSIIQNCSTGSKDKNGGGLYLKNSTKTTLEGTKIQNCTALGIGGGICHEAEGIFTVSDRSVISGNAAKGSMSVTSNNVTYQQSGGGIYTKAITFTLQDSSVMDNQAAGCGGGICQNYDGADGNMNIDGATITGNNSGAIGGGLYTLTNMTLKGIITITDNRLATDSDTANNAAGVYLRDGIALSLGETDGNKNQHVINVKGNFTRDGKPSNLRLPDTTSNGETVNDNKVKVYCGISGEIRVVNANKKLTQFGEAQKVKDIQLTNPAGFTDEHKVFLSEDGSLYGIVDRQDSTEKEIIWGGDPICKITDANGRLLYIDKNGVRPAVFDRLDCGDVSDTSTTSAFSTLRRDENLYYIDGTAYTENDYQIKMLVEEYSAEYYITATGGTDRNITLTTAKTTDTLHKYRGREGTRCIITRASQMNTSEPMVTAQTNLILQNIVVDGGSENDVTETENTRIIHAATADTKISIGRNATLQNGSTTGDGGAVYLNNGAQLYISGGSIRNCSAADGGAVYIDGIGGTMVMSAGSTITKCTATENGGGVYFNNGIVKQDAQGNPESGFIRITGGNITRCTATNGGGVYLNGATGSRQVYMSGGSISGNTVTGAGGGIFIGNNEARLYFSGAPYVYQNTSDSAVTPEDCISPYSNANNIVMDHAFDRNADNPGTVIVSRGLIRGTAIGVYVPEADNHIKPGEEGVGTGHSLYDNHGAERDPFATFENNATGGLNYFINDRNGMKGGQLDDPSAGDKKVYWRIIYALAVTKQVLSDDPSDDNKSFRFVVQLTGSIKNADGSYTDPYSIDGKYGDMTFEDGRASFTLKNGKTMTAELLPLGFGYRVEEQLDSDQRNHFKTTALNSAGEVQQQTDINTGYPYATGEMDTAAHYTYTVVFSNLHAICKITDDQRRLLYTKNAEGTYSPAIYSMLVTAFNNVNKGTDNEWYYKDESDRYERVVPDITHIEMLVPNYDMTEPASLMKGQKTILTTANPNATDGFPYVGGTSTAKITRTFNHNNMITVSNGDLTLGKITLDGGSTKTDDRTTTYTGRILNVNKGSTLTVGTGVRLQNSKTSDPGTAIYLAEGSNLKISGAPVFENNMRTNAVTEQEATSGTNGNEQCYTGRNAKQDIYIAGYQNADAVSIVITGNISSEPGSIWVWADKSPHYIQNQQFAVMSGGTWNGLDAFRNARTDETTNNPMRGDPKYLYGIARDGKVFWSGSMNLTVSKTVTDELPGVVTEFNFIVTITDPNTNNGPYSADLDYARYELSDGNWVLKTPSLTSTPNPLSVDAENNGQYNFTLTNKQKIVISIPRGLDVTVSEAENAAYAASYQIDDATAVGGTITSNIAMNHDTTVAYMNTRRKQTVTVSKTLVGTQTPDPITFTFTALLEYNDSGIADYTMNTGIVTADGTGREPAGQAEFTLSPTISASDSIVLTIPYGTNLTVTEDTSTSVWDKTVAESFDTSVAVNDGTETTASSHTFENITDDQTLDFTNTRKRASLTITKIVIGANDNQPFSFTVTGLETGKSYSYTKQSTVDGTIWTDVENGTGTLQEGGEFTLTHHQRIVIGQLPLDREITITEDNGNYTPTWTTSDPSAATLSGTNGTATVTLSENAAITVTNTREVRTVNIEKIVANNSNTTESFLFTARLWIGNTPLSDYTIATGKVTDSNGEVTFSLMHGGIQTLNIPDGAKLVVTETPSAYFTPNAVMFDANNASIRDGDEVPESFTLDSVTTNGTITFTNTPKSVRSVKFDVNGGTWTSTQHFDEMEQEDLYEIIETNIIDNEYKPNDPTCSGKVFIGWTKYAELAAINDFSGTDPITIGDGEDALPLTPGTGENLLDKVRSEALWDFSQKPPYGKTLYAVWSDTVTVTFDIVREGSYLHIWDNEGTPTTDIPGSYVYYRNSATSDMITYTLAKGERVPKPSDPTTNQTNWVFVSWLKNYTGYRNSTKQPSDNNIRTNTYDFTDRVDSPITLSTSWTTNQPQIFTFKVKNEVINGPVGEEFTYTIGISDVWLIGKENNTNTVINPDTDWGSISTQLKNNEEYKVIVTVAYNTESWKGNSVNVEVVDRDGIVIKTGHLLVHDPQSKPNFASDYRYTLSITQTEKSGYTTTVETRDPIGSITFDPPSNRTFTFVSKEYRSKSVNNATATFSSEVNNYCDGTSENIQDMHAGNHGLTIVFTNTSPSRNLTVTKTVAGTDDTSDTFNFTAEVGGITDEVNYWWQKYSTSDGTTYTSMTGTGSTGTGTLTSIANTINFTLGHHQKIVIGGLPENATVNMTEINGEYTASWLQDGTAITQTDGTGTSAVTVELTADTTLDVTNTKSQEEIIVAPTGINTRHTPFLLLLLFGLMLLIGGVGVMKKRAPEDLQAETTAISATSTEHNNRPPEMKSAPARKASRRTKVSSTDAETHRRSSVWVNNAPNCGYDKRGHVPPQIRDIPCPQAKRWQNDSGGGGAG